MKKIVSIFFLTLCLGLLFRFLQSIGDNRLKMGELPTNAKVFELGRRLFYDPILSGNKQVSCSSCHIQEFAFSDTAKLSKGINGQTITRHSMPLANLKHNKFFFWDGRVKKLEDQVFIPIRHPKEMGGNLETIVNRLNADPVYKRLFHDAFGTDLVDTLQIKASLVCFIEALESKSSPMDRVFEDPKNRVIDEHRSGSSVQSDFEVMVNLFERSLNSKELFLMNAFKSSEKKIAYSERSLHVYTVCIQCHDKNFMGDEGQMKCNGLDSVSKDLGLGAITKNEKDIGKFKVPSFRNLFKTPPYMHDGRYKTIDEVIDHYSTGIENHPNLDPILKENGKPIRFNLTPQEKEELKGFLLLTEDTAFIHNKAFSNPFLP